MLTVRQSGEGEGPRWERYFQIMGHGWEGALQEMKEYMDREAQRTAAGMTRKVSGLITSLTLWDVVAMNIVAIVGLRWISRSARIGAPAVTLWILACLLFFVPLAAVLAELSSRHPQQGGIYAWARRAFGPTHGFVCGWCMWVNNLFYFPALLLFAAANALIPLGVAGEMAESRLYSVTFVLGFLWATTFLNIFGFSAGKWLQHVGSVATWIPAAILIACGAIAFATLGSATSFAPAELLPRENFWDTIGFWSSLCFAFSGFEISSMVGQEVYNPRKTIPRSIVLSGIAITAIYILSSASILVAVPASEMAERSGIADAVELVTEPAGLRRHRRLHRVPARRRIDRRHQLVDCRRRARAVCRRRGCRDARGVREAAFEVPHAACGADRSSHRDDGAVSGERLPVGGRRRDDDPGSLRHHGEPHHPDLLPAVSLSVRRVHPPAIDGPGHAGG